MTDAERIEAQIRRAESREKRINELLLKVNTTIRCVVCGAKINGKTNHRCSRKAIQQYRYRLRRLDKEPMNDERTFDDKINEAFELTKGYE